jgi:hypothetical protein
VRPDRRGRPPLLGELAVVLGLLWVYDRIRALEAARTGPALAHARALLAAERLLHVDVELSATRWAAGHPVVSAAAAWWYQLAHVTVTLAVLAWCYVSRPDRYRRFRTALVLTNVVGLVVYVVFPVMPPRLLPGGGYADAVAATGFAATESVAGQYGAMPSLHLAWATWSAAVLLTLLPRGRRLALAYPAVTAAVVVLTGNHYVLDVLAGVATALLALLLTGPGAPGHRTPGDDRAVRTAGGAG